MVRKSRERVKVRPAPAFSGSRLGTSASRTALLAISRRSGRFSAFFGGTGPAAAEVIRKDNEQLHHRRFVIHAKQRRDVETRISTWSPGRSRPDNETVVRFSPNAFVGKTAKEKFHSALQFF